ncbi:MAG: hypothetical protein AAGG01_19975, partial [Planctomycetota bacterium]
ASEPFVLAMEPTGLLEVVVTAPDGKPLEGATVYCSPNVRWSGGYSDIFLDRTARSKTNAQGLAILENLPAEEEIHVGVYTKEGYLIPQSTFGNRSARLLISTIQSGEKTQLAVQLDPALGPEGDR